MVMGRGCRDEGVHFGEGMFGEYVDGGEFLWEGWGRGFRGGGGMI